MDMRGLTMIGGAICLMAAPVAYKFMGPAEGSEAPAEDVAAAPEQEAAPAEPVRREMAGGAVFVTARD